MSLRKYRQNYKKYVKGSKIIIEAYFDRTLFFERMIEMLNNEIAELENVLFSNLHFTVTLIIKFLGNGLLKIVPEKLNIWRR